MFSITIYFFPKQRQVLSFNLAVDSRRNLKFLTIWHLTSILQMVYERKTVFLFPSPGEIVFVKAITNLPACLLFGYQALQIYILMQISNTIFTLKTNTKMTNLQHRLVDRS